MISAPLRVFISSPGDVGAERAIARKVIDEVRSHFASHARIEYFMWEDDPTSIPSELPSPADFDVVVGIFWSRLGTTLSDGPKRADGTHYRSSVEFEIDT